MFLWKVGVGHTSGQGIDNCMGFRRAVLEGGDCASLPEGTVRSIAQERILAAGSGLLSVLVGLQSSGMSFQKRIYQERFQAKTPPLPQKDSNLMERCCKGFVFFSG